MAVGQPVTIADMAAGAQTEMRKGTLEFMADLFALSDLLSFVNVDAMTVSLSRINPDMQPPARYRNLNSPGVFVSGALESYTETLKILHEAVKMDKYLMMDKSNLFTTDIQVEFAANAMQLEITNAFLNGDGTTEFNVDGGGLSAQEPKGMRPRLQNRVIEGMDADIYTLGITGASLDLSTNPITPATAYNLADSLKELKGLTNANTLFTNFRGRTLLQRAAVQSGFLDTTQDNLFRTWDSIFGMRIVETTVKAPTRRLRNVSDSSNFVIPWQAVDGTDAPTTGKYTTFYAVNVGEGHVTGLTLGGMQEDGPNKLPAPDQAMAYDMSFAFGFDVQGFRDIGGLYGVKILP